MLSVKQGGIKYHFWVFGITRPGIEPRSPGPLANTLTIMPMSGITLLKKSSFVTSGLWRWIWVNTYFYAISQDSPDIRFKVNRLIPEGLSPRQYLLSRAELIAQCLRRPWKRMPSRPSRSFDSCVSSLLLVWNDFMLMVGNRINSCILFCIALILPIPFPLTISFTLTASLS